MPAAKRTLSQLPPSSPPPPPRYALVVLYADDNGNGGTFALFSILRRQGEQGIRGPALPSDRRLRYYRSASGNNVAIPDWRQKFIANRTVQTTIRVLVVIGVGAIMGDGVLTPAISGGGGGGWVPTFGKVGV